MPTDPVLSQIPFYGAYVARQRMKDEDASRELTQASVLQDLFGKVQAQERERQLRNAVAKSGGNLEGAMNTVLQSGDITGAARLSQVVEAQRKANAGQPIGAGGLRLPDGTIVSPMQRPEASPEIVRLQTHLRNLPAGDPQRGPIEQRIAHLAGGGQDRPFGAGATGGALELITRFAPRYADGTLTDDQNRLFDAAVTHYTQPRQYMDPDTGLPTTRRPELPEFVQQAISRRRRGGPTPQPAPRPAPGAGGMPSEPGAAPREAPRAGNEEQTIWGLASLTTGPVPAAAEALSRTPLLGEVVRAPQFTQARSFVPLLQRDLVRVLQNNPRYAEGERRAIEQEININPSVFDTPAAFRDRLVGIDRALQIRERNAFATANSARVGREERIQAMNVLNALTKFRQNLGVPPSIRGDSDWRELPSGAEYIDPQGQIRRKK